MSSTAGPGTSCAASTPRSSTSCAMPSANAAPATTAPKPTASHRIAPMRNDALNARERPPALNTQNPPVCNSHLPILQLSSPVCGRAALSARPHATGLLHARRCHHRIRRRHSPALCARGDSLRPLRLSPSDSRRRRRRRRRYRFAFPRRPADLPAMRPAKPAQRPVLRPVRTPLELTALNNAA